MVTFRRQDAMRRAANNTAIMLAFGGARDSTKYEHVVAFTDALPAIRERLEEHMALWIASREVLETM